MFEQLQKNVLEIELGGKEEFRIKNVSAHRGEVLIMALQLVQSLGETEKEVVSYVEHIFNQDSPSPYVVMGDLIVKLAVLCNAVDIDMEAVTSKQFNTVVDRRLQPSIKHFLTTEFIN